MAFQHLFESCQVSRIWGIYDCLVSGDNITAGDNIVTCLDRPFCSAPIMEEMSLNEETYE